MHHLKIQGAIALALAVIAPIQAQTLQVQNLVFNGSFEINGGLGQLAPNVSSVSGWTSTGTPTDGETYAWNFVVNASADTVGFPSVYSPSLPDIKLWGPGTGANNLFTGSPDGGFFMGLGIGYATAALSQTISGLTPGQSYYVSFQWAAAYRFPEAVGETSQGLWVTLGTSSWGIATTIGVRGFSGWMTESRRFTAESETQTLSFLAYEISVGSAPFVLLDGVTLTTSPIPEPESYAMVAGLGLAAIGMARWRAARRALAS